MTHNGDFLHSPMFYFVAYKGFQNYHRGYHTGGECFFFFFRESSAGIAKHHFVYHFSYFSSDESTNNSFGRAIFFFSWDRDFT